MNDYKFELMHISDICLLLELRPNEVYKLCREGKIKGTQRANGYHWDIPTEQFRNHPNWQKFLTKKEENKQKSLKIVEALIEVYRLANEEEEKTEKRK